MLTVTDYASVCAEISQEHSQEQSDSPLLVLIAEKMGTDRFRIWFGQDTQCEENGEKITLYVRNDFALNSIRRHCQQEIEQAVLELFGKNLPIELVVKPTPKIEAKKSVVTPSIPKPIQETNTSPLRSFFNMPGGEKPRSKTGNKTENKTESRFATLTTFHSGISNSLACRAADLAINHPGEINPIYIFGPGSVGKTHLLQGIWSEVRKKTSRRHPIYMTAENFMSSFIETIRSGSPQDRNQTFRSRFKEISHLLIDDIHFFSARAMATQTEFLQIFDALRSRQVQFVFTGDRPLKDLPMRNELIERLKSGFVCNIDLPERELSLKICESMVKQRELPLGDGVCRLIASRFGTNARQMLGALNCLHLHYLTSGEPMTLAAAEEALSDLLRLNSRNVRLPEISKLVSEEFGISEETLRSKSRSKQVVTPRMLAMWLARKYTRSALSEIGLYFGKRSHSSVHSAQKNIDKQICDDETIAEIVQKLERVLG